jgi:ABC-type sulfate transport system permease subunit
MALDRFAKIQWGPGALALFIGLFLFVFLVVPVAKVVFVAFQDPNTGALTLVNFVDFFNTSLFQESFFNSLYVASASVLLSSVIAIPLAYFTTRFNFGGRLLHHPVQFRRRRADPDAGRHSPDHAALRRRGGDAFTVRRERLGQPHHQ